MAQQNVGLNTLSVQFFLSTQKKKHSICAYDGQNDELEEKMILVPNFIWYFLIKCIDVCVFVT